LTAYEKTDWIDLIKKREDIVKISGIFFAIVLLAFLLPFMVVKCQDQPIAKMSGYKIAFGGNVKTETAEEIIGAMNESVEGLKNFADTLGAQVEEEEAAKEAEETEKPAGEKMKPVFWGILAILAAIAGLVTALILGKGMYVVPLVCAVIGFISLIFLPGAVKAQVLKDAANMPGISLKVSTMFAYWLSLLAFLAAAVTAWLANRKEPLITKEQVSNIVPDKLEDALDKAKDTISTAGMGAAGAVEDAFDKVKEAVQDADLDQKLDNLTDTVKEKVDETIDKVKDALDKDEDKPE
jgi:hypothetical protein